jgi:hypothetical protein
VDVPRPIIGPAALARRILFGGILVRREVAYSVKLMEFRQVASQPANGNFQ